MTRILTLAGVAALAALATACGSDEPPPAPTGNAIFAQPSDEASSGDGDGDASPGIGDPVVKRVALSPPTLTPGTEIRAIADASDPDGDAVVLEYVWTHNGREVRRGDQSSLYLVDLAKGDTVEVTVTASDGVNRSTPVSATARAGNRPPVLSAVTIEPFGDVRAGQELTATPHASDPDNDSLTFQYRWLVNGQEKGRERSFETKGLKRGDKVQALVIASDGRAESRQEYSPVLMLGNSPPVITQLPATRSEDGTFTYSFAARDPDGDPNLRFFVEKGPDGLRMDPITGVLTWTPRPDQAGTHPIEVGVKDGKGEGSTFSFELTVGVQQAPAARGS